MARKTQSPSTGGVYLYAVVNGAEAKDLGVKGLFDSNVYTVSEGDTSAVVSDLPSKTEKLRPERRHLSAHQGVLRELVQNNTVVLPVSFGTVADSANSIKSMLTRYQKDLSTQIHRVEGKVELEVRLTFDVPNVFDFLLTKNSDLKEARDRVFDKQHEPTRDEKIELGQLFESILNDIREKYVKKVEGVFKLLCSEMKRNKVRNEQELMRLSFLVGKNSQEGFQKAVQKVSEMFDDNYAFEVAGPHSPYNFIEVRVKV